MEWEYYKNNHQLREFSLEELETTEFLKKLLANREYSNEEEIKTFLSPTLSNFLDPYLFEKMEESVEKIIKIMKEEGKVTIYGDYDADGICSAVFLTLILRELGIKTDYYIPSRNEEEYGLNKKNIDCLLKNGTNLIITVDTSVASYDDIFYGKNNGIEVIITDHHKNTSKDEEKELLFINPKLSNNYPFKHLSGAGVALKLAQGLYKKLGLDFDKIYNYIDIIMIGTIADVVPSIGENRIIIKEGLKQLKKTKLKSLGTLLKYLKLADKDLTLADVSYFIVPLINSLGRVGTPSHSADFFLMENSMDIYFSIEEMKKSNKKRRELEAQIFKECCQIVESNKNEFMECIFLSSDKWHPGIIGVVASKLCLKYGKTVVLISISNGFGKGSSRSIQGVNIFNIFKKLESSFVRYGGHDYAAGFSAREENIHELKEGVISEIKKLSHLPVTKKIKVDMELQVEEVVDEILEDLEVLAPYGHGNPQPLFYDTNIKLKDIKKFGVSNNHFSGILIKNNKEFPVIGFDLGGKLEMLTYRKKTFDIIYYPEKINNSEDKEIQIKLKLITEVEE